MIVKEKGVKGIKKTILLLSSIFSVAAATQSFAAISLPCGWYADGDIGVTRMYGMNYPTVPSTASSGTAWSGDGGYKFNQYLGAEVIYTRYADTRLRNSAGTTLARDIRYSVAAAAKAMYPIMNSGVEIYGKLGLDWIHAKLGHIDATGVALAQIQLNSGTRTARGLYWGGGVQYYFNENVNAHIQYAQAQGNSNTGSVGVTSIGLSILF